MGVSTPFRTALALAAAALVLAMPAGAAKDARRDYVVAATGASAAPSGSAKVPKKTREALRAAPGVIAKAYAPIVDLAEAVDGSVPDQIQECQAIKAIEASDPGQAVEPWITLSQDAFTNATNIATSSTPKVDAFEVKVRALRAHLRALPRQKRDLLDRAIANLLGAARAWRQFFIANIQAAQSVAARNCDEALTFRQAGRRHESDARDASIEGQELLEKLAKGL